MSWILAWQDWHNVVHIVLDRREAWGWRCACNPWKVTERKKSDKSDSIVNRFYQKRSIKTSMVAWSPTHAQEQQHRFQTIRLRRYLYNRCDNIRYIELPECIAVARNTQHQQISSSHLFSLACWPARSQFSILLIIIPFSLESFVSRRAHQPNQANHQRRPDCREVSSETMAGCKD